MVNEDLREEVNKGQKEGEECDVIKAIGEQKEAGYHTTHSMGTSMVEQKKDKCACYPIYPQWQHRGQWSLA